MLSFPERKPLDFFQLPKKLNFRKAKISLYLAVVKQVEVQKWLWSKKDADKTPILPSPHKESKRSRDMILANDAIVML